MHLTIDTSDDTSMVYSEPQGDWLGLTFFSHLQVTLIDPMPAAPGDIRLSTIQK